MKHISLLLSLVLVLLMGTVGYTEDVNADGDASLINSSAQPLSENNTLQEFSERADELIEERLSKISDPLTRLQVEKKLHEQKAQHMERMAKWIQERQKAIAEAKMKQAADDLAMTLNDSKLSARQVRDRLNVFEKENSMAYSTIYGPNAGEKIREAKANAVKNYLADTAVKSPNILKFRINLFDDVVPATY